MEEVHLDVQPGYGPRERRDLRGREGRDVSVDADDRVPGREQPFGCRPLGPPGAGGRAFPKEVVERLPSALSDEPLRNDQALPVRLGEGVSHLQARITGVAG